MIFRILYCKDTISCEFIQYFTLLFYYQLDCCGIFMERLDNANQGFAIGIKRSFKEAKNGVIVMSSVVGAGFACPLVGTS
jgi:hypothetical protein